MDNAPHLDDAIGRLKAFHASWKTGDEIDEETGLTADDLGVIVGFLQTFRRADDRPPIENKRGTW